MMNFSQKRKLQNDDVEIELNTNQNKNLKEYHLFSYPFPYSVGLITFQNKVVGFFNSFQIVFIEEIPLDYIIFLIKDNYSRKRKEGKREVKFLYGDAGFRHLIKALKDYFSGKIDKKKIWEFLCFAEGLLISEETIEALWKYFFHSEESLSKWLDFKKLFKPI